MAPLIVLALITLLARLMGALGVGYVATWPAALAVGLAAMFLLTAGAHVFEPRRSGLIAIVPPSVPFPAAMVTVTGVLEVTGAVGLLVPPGSIGWVRPVAALCLALLMLVMFPANVRAAHGVRHPDAPTTPLPLRAAMQVVFVTAAGVVAVTSLLR